MAKKRKKINKTLFITIIILVFLLSIMGLFIYEKYQKRINEIEVVLNDNLKVEINTEVKISDFIYSINTGKMITENSIIDTTKLGKQSISIDINYNEKIHNYSFEIEVIDTIMPTIEAKEEISIYVGNSINLLDGVIVTDNSKENIIPIIEGDYDFNVAGIYNLNYVATDSSNNKTTKSLTLKIVEDPNNRVITTSKGYTLKISNGLATIDGIVIANKSYGLPSNFGNGLTNETVTAFNSMVTNAASEGINIYKVSGYRSYYDQQYIYNNYVKRDGQAEADRYSARAGHSEHQTGMAIDVNSLYQSFENTPEGIWLNNNCHKYGFIIRYPKGKEEITGYMFEPWHVRYVGVDLASKLYNNGNWITIEEYFGIDSKY